MYEYFLHPLGGLCSRIFVTISAYKNLSSTGKVSCIWVPDNECPVRYKDLFKGDMGIVEHYNIQHPFVHIKNKHNASYYKRHLGRIPTIVIDNIDEIGRASCRARV